MTDSGKRKGTLAPLVIVLSVQLVASQSCDKNAVCIAHEFGFNCTCNNGYKGSTVGCININECNVSSPCGPNENCSDTDGSYICYCGVVNTTCAANADCVSDGGSQACACRNGYTGNGSTCKDLDECSDGSHYCHKHATCMNFPGNYTCSCNSGYTGNGTSCLDVDECTTGQHNCTYPTSCNNTEGSFACVCGDTVSCGDNARCVQTSNSSSCICNSGFTGDGMSCVQIDECTIMNCPTHAKCVKKEGRYDCVCNEGYLDDRTKCSGANRAWPVSLMFAFAIVSTSFTNL